MIDDLLVEGDHLKRRLDRLDSHPAEEAGRAAQGLKSEMSLLLDDVSTLLRNEAVINPELKNQLDAKFHEARGLLTQFADDTRETGRRLADETQQRVYDQLESTRATVIERPLSSVAVAAAIGLTVGMLIGNRR